MEVAVRKGRKGKGRQFLGTGRKRKGGERAGCYLAVLLQVMGLAPGGLAVVGRSAGGEPGPEAGRAADSGERPLAASPPGTVKAEEHQRQNINSECLGVEGREGGGHWQVHLAAP